MGPRACARLETGPVSLGHRRLLRPGNAGTALDGQNLDINANDVARLIKFSKTEKIDLTVIGPEAPLAAGMVDAFEDASLLVFGPTREAAELEGSKAFAKDLMRLANVPTADYAVFDDATAAAAHVEERSERPLVIKADGLAAGKGVIVCPTRRKPWPPSGTSWSTSRSARPASGSWSKSAWSARRRASSPSSTAAPSSRSSPPRTTRRPTTTTKAPTPAAWAPTRRLRSITPELLDEIIEKVLVPTVHAMKREGAPSAAFCTPA